ncbi:MAG: glycosyltransferase family 39 protein [Planctomycetota bacterium]
MSGLWAVALVVGLCAGFGALLDRALFGGCWAGGIERAGRALLLGLGGVGSASLALDAAGLPVRALPLALLLSTLSILLLLLLWRRRRSLKSAAAAAALLPAAAPLIPRTPAQLSTRLLAAGLLLFACFSLAQAVFSGLVRPTFQFDSLTRWMFKARVLCEEGSLRGALSTDPLYAFTHQRYPPLVSHVANLPALVSGSFDDRFAQAPFAWFAVALAAIVYGSLRRRAGALAAALGAAWVAGLPLLAYVPYPPPGSGAASAMADVPLALFATGALLALLDALEGRRDRAHLEVGLLLACAALTKNEGLPLVAGCAVTLLIFSQRGRWRAALGVSAVALLLYWLLWGRLAAQFPALDEHYPGRLHWEAVREGLARLPVVLAGFGEEVLSFRHWNLTWPAALLLFLLGRRERAHWALLLAVGLQLASYVLAFVITAWTSPAAEALRPGADPVEYLMTLTLGRLLLHVAPVVIAVALLAAPPLQRSPAPRG